MFYYHDETEIDGGLIKLAVLRSDLAPIPETLEMDIRLDNTNRALLQEGKDIYVGGGRAYRIVLAEVSRRTAQQGVRLVETVSLTAVLRELQGLTFVRERAIWLEDTTLTDIYRACGAKLQRDIKGDVAVPVYHCMVGDTPTFGIAKLFQEHGGVLRVNSDGELEFMRLPAIFTQDPVLYLPANVTEEITSGFIERHELPWFFSVDAGNNFVLGNNAKPRHVRYTHRASEDVLRNMTRVLIQSKRARVDVNLSICAGDCAELSDGSKHAVLTAAHYYATGTDGIEVSQYSRVWLGVLTGSETGSDGSVSTLAST